MESWKKHFALFDLNYDDLPVDLRRRLEATPQAGSSAPVKRSAEKNGSGSGKASNTARENKLKKLKQTT